MTNKEIAQIIMDAWDHKDEVTLRKYLHPHYICKDPMTTTEGIDKTIEKMKAFSFVGDLDMSLFTSQGDNVIVEGIWRVESPIQADIPMISVMFFENNQQKEKRIYFDPSKLSR